MYVNVTNTPTRVTCGGNSSHQLAASLFEKVVLNFGYSMCMYAISTGYRRKVDLLLPTDMKSCVGRRGATSTQPSMSVESTSHYLRVWFERIHIECALETTVKRPQLQG